jgi:drug/metabolite transporter (DMT)-like permease
MSDRRFSSLLGASLAAAGSSVALGSSVAASSQLTDYPTTYSQALRYGLAAVVLWVLAGGRIPRLTGGQLLRLVALASSGLIGFNFFLLMALRDGDAGTVGAIIGAVPVVLAVVGPILSGGRPSWLALLAALVVVVGAAIVHGVDVSTPPDALLWAILAMICEAGFSLLAIPILKQLKPITLSMSVAAVAAVLLLVAGLVLDGTAVRAPNGAELWAIVYLALVATAAAFVLWYSSLTRMPVEVAGLFAGLVPVAALLTSAAVGATTITAMRLSGALLVGAGVVGGVLASQAANRNDKTRSPSSTVQEV